MTEETCATLDLERESTIREFGDRLREWGFPDSSIGDFTGKPGQETARAEDLCLVMHQTGGGSPLGAMVRLFVMGFPADPAELEASVGRTLVDALRAMGVIELREGRIIGLVQIHPFRKLLFAYDPPTGFQTPEYVMGPAQSSVTLATMTVRRPVRRALDLGCGCGVHAILAADHSDRVVAIDMNPRAVTFTRFNALLNGIDNVEVNVGDMFEPIDGAPFDLVTANPPFVIGPDSTFTYRDSPLKADGVTRSAARVGASLLGPGGTCSIIGDWAHLQGTDWKERIRSWFSGERCDVWVLRTASFRPEAYASTWIGHTESGSIDGRLESFSRWMDYYREQSIVQLDAGMMVIRKRDTGDGWFEVREAPGRMLGSCSDSIVRFFEVQDWLAGMGDDQGLIGAKLKLAQRTELNQSFTGTEQGWATRRSTIRVREGFAYEGDIEEMVVEVLPAFNGERTVEVILTRLAEVVELDPEELRPSMLRILRAMLEQGVLDRA